MVTVITLGTAGTIVLVATPAGCRVGLQLAGTKCQAPSPLAGFPGATPTAGATFSAVPTSGQSTSPSPFEPPASNSYPTPTPPPYNSNPNVPHDPSLPPYEFDVGSGSFPPAYPEITSGFATPSTFSCRLPIFANGPGSGGFIVFPDRTFIGDPRSGVALPPSGASPPPQGPYGQPLFFGLSYDRAVSRWVPVQRSWVAPDGKHYAYPDFSDGIEIVDVVANTQVKVGAGKHWQVIDVEAEGVYAGQLNIAGLWLVPFTGAASQITAEGYWSSVGGGAAYGTDTSSLPYGVPTVIVRIDLKTHVKQNWFEVNNATSFPWGFDGAGHAIMVVQPIGQGQSFLWLVTGLGNALVISSNNSFSGPPVADKHGLWFMNYQTTFLWVPGVGMQVQANIGGNLAGACI